MVMALLLTKKYVDIKCLFFKRFVKKVYATQLQRYHKKIIIIIIIQVFLGEKGNFLRNELLKA